MNKLTGFFYTSVIKFLANFKTDSKVKFNSSDIDKVAEWVIAEDKKEDKKGWEKADEVVKNFNAKWGERLSWVVKTVVQLCYAYVMIKGQIKK